MNNTPQTTNAFEKALIEGNLQSLKPEERLAYYKNVCESLGLNPLTKPFEYIQLNGKLTLYATKACTEQLRQVHGISLKISDRQKFDDVYVVTANAKSKDGREDESTGAVNITGLKGEALANAFMKAETKAKRRVTLSICGLAMLDETEVATIPHAQPFTETQLPPAPSSFSEPRHVEQPSNVAGDILPKPMDLNAPVTQKTLSDMVQVAKSRQWPNRVVSDFIKSVYEKQSAKDLTQGEAEMFIQTMRDYSFTEALRVVNGERIRDVPNLAPTQGDLLPEDPFDDQGEAVP